MILQCSHIDKSFQGEAVLQDISFSINDHEKTAVVGINGSGKTTLLKILTGEYAADSGEVILRKDAVVGYLAQNSIPAGQFLKKWKMPKRTSLRWNSR